MVFKRLQKGFTLIELLMVISILTILTSIVVAVLVDAKIGAENNRKNEVVAQYSTALALYHNKYGIYPQGGCTEESECGSGNVSHVCIGDYPSNDCFVLGNHQEDPAVNQAISEFAPANLVSLSTTIVGEYEFTGVVYGCTSPTCEHYRLSWVLEGEGSDASCYGGGTEHDLGDVSLCVFSTDPNLNSTISGCTNPRGENFNFFATIDNGSCVINGCMNSNAYNYDSEVTHDDGSCTYWTCNTLGWGNYQEVSTTNSYEYDALCMTIGCTNSNAYNWTPGANVEDGSCTYWTCNTPGYDNYQEVSTTNSWEYNALCANEPVPGCMNSNAYNWNSMANQDDGSCMFYKCNTPGYDNYQEDTSPYHYEYNLFCANDQILGCTNNNAYNYNINANQDDGSCTYWTCNTYGYDNYQEVSTTNQYEYNMYCANDPILGCTNGSAYNWNSMANQDDGSCMYYICDTYGWNNYHIGNTPNAWEYNSNCNND